MDRPGERPVLLLLAAGASSRMRGGDKLLEEVVGQPLLRRQAAAARSVLDHVLVALAPAGAARAAALRGLDVIPLEVADAAEGMGHSIAAGARRALADSAPALMILNADMPLIGAPEIAALATAWQSAPTRIWRGMTPDGRPGHPVVFPAHLLGKLADLTGDTGAKALIAREGTVQVALPGEAAVLDLDTPEDWAAWRGRPGDQ